MLTKGDDFPLHQLPEPIAYAGSDRNFYDRYFFNGYSRSEACFFALALGVYPVLNIMDASFSIIKDGTQYNLRASRHLGMERMDTRVGPIAVEVMEPLKTLRIHVDQNAYGIQADLIFRNRSIPLEEPRYIHRVGPRVIMDYTRLTQNGAYSGFFEVNGSRVTIEPENWMGTRDRSWGVRPVGARDPQMPGEMAIPQFYWLWAPVNFEDCITLYDINADASGNAWHTHGVMVPVGDGQEPVHMQKAKSRMHFKSGTRHAASAEITLVTPTEEILEIQVSPLYHFYMSGIGYMHPDWSHGLDKGELAVAHDTIDLKTADPANPMNLHIQAVSEFRMKGKTGMGVLEQLIIGPHAPSGFTDILDMAP
jgi:hypothetical protein